MSAFFLQITASEKEKKTDYHIFSHAKNWLPFYHTKLPKKTCTHNTIKEQFKIDLKMLSFLWTQLKWWTVAIIDLDCVKRKKIHTTRTNNFQNGHRDAQVWNGPTHIFFDLTMTNICTLHRTQQQQTTVRTQLRSNTWTLPDFFLANVCFRIC